MSSEAIPITLFTQHFFKRPPPLPPQQFHCLIHRFYFVARQDTKFPSKHLFDEVGTLEDVVIV